MLILTRRPTERVMIGNDIVVEILEVRGNQVRLGFKCPKDIPVHREEIYERIQNDIRNGVPLQHGTR